MFIFFKPFSARHSSAKLKTSFNDAQDPQTRVTTTNPNQTKATLSSCKHASSKDASSCKDATVEGGDKPCCRDSAG